jgi:hypothetical protein
MMQVIETIISIIATTALRHCQDLLTTEAKVFFMSRPIFDEKRRAFPNSQHTLLREHSCLGYAMQERFSRGKEGQLRRSDTAGGRLSYASATRFGLYSMAIRNTLMYC